MKINLKIVLEKSRWKDRVILTNISLLHIALFQGVWNGTSQLFERHEKNPKMGAGEGKGRKAGYLPTTDKHPNSQEQQF